MSIDTAPSPSPSDALPGDPLGQGNPAAPAPGASVDAGPQGPTQPKTDVYTVMLILSLIAIIVACTVLYFELSTYGEWPQWRIPANLK